MALKGLILDRSDRTVWAEYRDGFEVEIRYLPRARLRGMLDRAARREWDSKNHRATETIDGEKFARLMAEEVVAGWRGLTPEVLKKMVDMQSYPDSDVPYSAEDCAELLQKAYGFDTWVQQICSDLEAFEAARRAAEEKNS